MSSEIFFNGRRFLSAQEAGSSAALTSDYVARLCRSGKVAGRRVGKKWYVDAASFRAFLNEAEAAQMRRKEELSKIRAEEYRRGKIETSRAAIDDAAFTG